MKTAEEKAKELYYDGGDETELRYVIAKKQQKAFLKGVEFAQQQTTDVECACGDCLPNGSDLALKMGWRYVEDELTCGNCIAATPTQDKVREAAEKIHHLHLCEQEALQMPTAKEWFDAVNELGEALNSKKR